VRTLLSMPPEQPRMETPSPILPVAHPFVLVVGEGVKMGSGMGICVQTVVDEGI